MTAEQKTLVEHAAALEGRSITNFLLEAAKRAVTEHEVIQLSAEDSETFVNALLNPRKPSDEMRARVTTYMALMGDPSN